MSSSKQILVPIGEMRVSADPGSILFTCVGSCCGVALYDPQKKVAGLLHIVLPSNRGQLQTADRPAFFADTGIPLLIKKMEERGAVRKQMTAAVVGGACLTPHGDPAIGRSNIEKSLSLLERVKIPVLIKETGGIKGRNIEVHVITGDIRIRTRSSSRVELAKMDTDEHLAESELTDLAASLERMQVDPQVAGRLFDAVHQNNINWQLVTELVHQDIVLALHIFHKCNSPYYGIPQEIDSIEAALNHLGSDKLRRVCVVAAAEKNNDVVLADIGIDQKSLSRHCLASASIAQFLAGEICPVMQQEAFTAAFFHPLGYIAATMVAQKKKASGRESTINNCHLFDVNDSTVVKYRTYLARHVLTKWHFPQIVVEAVASARLGPSDLDSARLDVFVTISCCISILLGIVDSQEKMGSEAALNALEQINTCGDAARFFRGIMANLRLKGLLP